MSKIRLNGTTSGYTEIAPPATAGDNTITLPSSNGSANQFLKNGSTAGTLGWSSMVETATGVGIGTASPSFLLDAQGSGTVTINATTTDTSGFAVGRLRAVYTGGGGGANSIVELRAGDGYSVLYNATNTPLLFSTNGTERARITSGGNVAINNASADGRINAQFNGASEIGYMSRDTSNTGTTAAVRFYRNTTSQVGEIATSTTGTAYNTSSDYRLKENVVPLTGATERLAQLPVHRFNFIADPDCTVDGFLAHEAQAVVPECVTGEKDAVDADGSPIYQGIDQSKLVPLLTAALQEALTEIADLKARITALEAV